MPTVKTEWQLFSEKWGGGCGSGLCERADRVCLARGDVPADVVFIGEAPGPSENVLGRPFCGPAGHLLDRIVRIAGGEAYRRAYTNLVCCIPWDERRVKFEEPPAEAVKCCSDRLREFLCICRPRLIVTVGALAKKYCPVPSDLRTDGKEEQPEWIPEDGFLQYCDIVHPAAILRASVVQRGIMEQRATVRLAQALEELGPPR